MDLLPVQSCTLEPLCCELVSDTYDLAPKKLHVIEHTRPECRTNNTHTRICVHTAHQEHITERAHMHRHTHTHTRARTHTRERTNQTLTPSTRTHTLSSNTHTHTHTRTRCRQAFEHEYPQGGQGYDMFWPKSNAASGVAGLANPGQQSEMSYMTGYATWEWSLSAGNVIAFEVKAAHPVDLSSNFSCTRMLSAQRSLNMHVFVHAHVPRTFLPRACLSATSRACVSLQKRLRLLTHVVGGIALLHAYASKDFACAHMP